MISLLLQILTFPGVIVHEMAHVHFCRRSGVVVHKACYFRFGRPAGYVIHDMPETAWQSMMIGTGPFWVNTLIGALLGVLSVLVTGRRLEWGITWLAVSIAMHAFPSTGDAKNIWRAAWSGRGSIFSRIVCAPVVVAIYVGAIGSVFWLDLLYGVAVGVGLPRLFKFPL